MTTFELTFNSKSDVVVGNGLHFPIPDGYHYNLDGSGVNQNWCYIVPESVSLDENHIDAKPFSFGITANPIGHITFEAEKIEAVKEVFIQRGFLDERVLVKTHICSAHCAFVYQSWTDNIDKTYNKIKGFLFAGNDIYQFHIYANHDEPIAQDETTISAFNSMSELWMDAFILNDDEDYQETAQKGDSGEVKGTIDDLTRMMETFSQWLPVRADIADQIKTCYAKVGVLFYKYYSLPIDEKAGALFAQMIDNINGKDMSKNLLMNLLHSTYGTIADVMSDYDNTYIVNQLVKQDKMVRVQYENGITIVHYNGIKELLLVLCGENGVDYTACEFSKECLECLEKVIKDKWDTTNILLFGDTSLSEVAGIKQNQSAVKKQTRETNSKQAQKEKAAAKRPKKPVMDESDDTFTVTESTVTSYNRTDPKAVIPEGITTIGEKAFLNHTELESVVIPSGVTVIEEAAFKGCRALKTVTLPDTLKKIGNYAFASCAELSEIVFPDGLETIGSQAFHACGSLRELSFPDSVKSIGLEAFRGCKKVKTVRHLPSGLKELKSTFSHCAGLKTVTLPDSLETLEGGVFCNCRNLTSVVIPEGVRELLPSSIGITPFWGCKNLVSITLPSTLTHIGEDCFRDCESLRELVIPDAVEKIDGAAFYGCKNLLSISLPTTLTYIGNECFRDCESLRELVIPDAVEIIGMEAFAGCTNLKEIVIPPKTVLSDLPLGFDNEKLNVVFKVYRDSPAHEVCKKSESSYNKLKYVVILTPEQQAAKRRAEEERKEQERLEAERRRREQEEKQRAEEARVRKIKEKIAALQNEIAEQEAIIAANGGLFGEKARKRKAAKEKIQELNLEIAQLEDTL